MNELLLKVDANLDMSQTDLKFKKQFPKDWSSRSHSQVVKPLRKENYATRFWQEQSNFRKYLQGTLLFPSNKDILNLVVVLLG